MAKFKVQTNDNQKFVLVDPADYTHKITFSNTPSTSRHGNLAVDNFRHKGSVSRRFLVGTSAGDANEVKQVRDESVAFSYVVAAGQSPAYYAAKASSLTEAAHLLISAAANIATVKLGSSLPTDIDVVV